MEVSINLLGHMFKSSLTGFKNVNVEPGRMLPKTNCREWGEVTCMLFALRVAEGAKDVNACSPLVPENPRELEHYMSQFNLWNDF
jgi:ArsR family metal-binding transcriptional regulator